MPSGSTQWSLDGFGLNGHSVVGRQRHSGAWPPTRTRWPLRNPLRTINWRSPRHHVALPQLRPHRLRRPRQLLVRATRRPPGFRARLPSDAPQRPQRAFVHPSSGLRWTARAPALRCVAPRQIVFVVQESDPARLPRTPLRAGGRVTDHPLVSPWLPRTPYLANVRVAIRSKFSQITSAG